MTCPACGHEAPVCDDASAEVLHSTIHLASVAHGNDLDAAARVVNEVEDTVIADANSIGLVTLELDGAGRAGRGPQANDPFDDPVVCRSREAAQLALG